MNFEGNIYFEKFFQIQRLQHLDQHSYCVSYECVDEEKWGTKASVCLCPSQNELKEINKTVSSAIRRCCGSSPRYNKNCETKELDIVHLEEDKPCTFDTTFELDGSKIKFKGKELSVDSNDICVGPSMEKKGLKMKLFNCEPPCNGRIPCIR